TGTGTAERELRHRRVREAMAEQGLDALLAFAPAWRRENVRYFTDAPAAGTATFALVPAAGPVTAFSHRPADLHGILSGGWASEALALDAHAPGALTDRLRGLRPARLGIAHYELLPQLLAAELKTALPTTEIVSATKLMDDIRLVKSDWEID